MAVGEDTIPLFAAAAIAYEQVFSTRRTEGVMPSVDELDLVALALSTRLPIYGVRAPGQEASRISDEELTRGWVAVYRPSPSSWFANRISRACWIS